MATATLTPTATRVNKIDGFGILSVVDNDSIQAGLTAQGPAWSVMKFVLPTDFLGSTIIEATLTFPAMTYGGGLDYAQTKLGIPTNTLSFTEQDGGIAGLGSNIHNQRMVDEYWDAYMFGAGNYEHVIDDAGSTLELDLKVSFLNAWINGRLNSGEVQIVWQLDFMLFGGMGEAIHYDSVGTPSLYLEYTPAPIRLSIPTSADEGDTVTGSVIRTGSTAASLVVTLSQSPSGRVDIPATVTIPIGETTATFDIEGLVGGLVEITATAGSDSWTATMNIVGDGLTGFPASTLTGLISVWQLDEASGTATDAFGTNHLTDNNTVTSGTGVFAGCRTFTAANSEYLSIASNSSLVVGDEDFTFSGWIKLTSQPSSGAEFDILSKYETSTNNREYRLHYINSGGTYSLIWSLCANGSCSVFTQPTRAGQLTNGQWYWFCAWHDSVNNVAGLQVDTEMPVTASYSSGVFSGNSPFHLGSLGRSATTFFLNGSLDRVGFWKRVLTPAERAALANPSGPPLGSPASIIHFIRQMIGSH